MMIQDIMTTDVVYITDKTSIKDALSKMEQFRIRHLPVVNERKEIIGIVSDRDLRDASPSSLGNCSKDVLQCPIKEIMKTDVLTALPYDFVEEAANMMMENRISCLPVEDNGKLIGIITGKDLLKNLVKLTGADLPSSRLEVEVLNQSGMLAEVAALIKEHKINIHSVLIYPSMDESKKILVFRLQTMDLRPLIKTLKDNNYHILWPDMEMRL
ncbi:MAG: acetoin utilization AcuB family protein [Bacillus sp. (in: Bacteria)]|nr:acetoin utilization AcuB family protein [Bacillus sp. (in: firmicutes)]